MRRIETIAEGVTLHPECCLDALAAMDADSVDSCVTDPPYGLGFMGRHWDHGVPGLEYWQQIARVLKPGAHLLAFGGTRTYHRMACAIEDAGFEIRDSIQWIYGSGFPKSHDVSKGIDRAAPRAGMFDEFARHFAAQRAALGLTQKVIAVHFPSKTGGFTGCVWNWENGANVPTVAQWHVLQPLLNLSDEWLPLIERVEAEREIIGRRKVNAGVAFTSEGPIALDVTAPATDAARQWDGWGTALKPACEPIVLARKPLSESTVAANVLKWGTGAINVDGCRIGTSKDVPASASKTPNNIYGAGMTSLTGGTDNSGFNPNIGRWPANVIHDGSDEVVGAFPETESGSRRAGEYQPQGFYANAIARRPDGMERDMPSLEGSSGSAARFFYTAKADSDDRLGSKHPTVKPVDLIQYLVRLVTPKGGLCLDPFAGTGTLGEACIREGMRAVLIEREEEYQTDIRRRMKLAMAGPDERLRESAKAKNPNPDLGPLFDGLALTGGEGTGAT